MSTTEGEEPEEKKYCCGNSAQNEAGYVSKCDIVRKSLQSRVKIILDFSQDKFHTI